MLDQLVEILKRLLPKDRPIKQKYRYENAGFHLTEHGKKLVPLLRQEKIDYSIKWPDEVRCGPVNNVKKLQAKAARACQA